MEEFNAFIRLIETLRAQPVLTLFLILGMGYLLGNIRIGSFSLGPVPVCCLRAFSLAISIFV
jgi:putative transport protein